MPLDPSKYIPTLTTKDEGTVVSSRTKSLNFTGAGATATSSNDEVTINIPSVGGGGGLLAANNLSDVNSAATSRSNLGLGNSATKNVGTGSGEVAAGDHTHAALTWQ